MVWTSEFAPHDRSAGQDVDDEKWPNESCGDLRLIVGRRRPRRRKLQLWKELVPVGVQGRIEASLDRVVGTSPGLMWLVAERHARFGDALPALAVIAGTACGHDVIPCVHPAA